MARRFLKPDDDATPPPTTAPPAGIRWDLHGSAAKVAIAGNVLVAVLFFVAVMWRIFFWRTGQAEGAVAPEVEDAAAAAAARPSSSGASTPCESPRAAGMRKEELLALPVFVHCSPAAAAEDGAGVGGTKVECAVCISELRDGDAGRLLPRCGHRFHAECVDRWFRSHVTCPLCRAVVAGGGSGQPDPKVQPGV
ncbi:hypothetical protein ACP70R_048781 [Stipagrostis hirtigluma subsp. patula]